jgi:glycosidase
VPRIPDWLPGRTWYHVYALGACGAPKAAADEAAAGGGAVVHRLGALVEWVDHLADLGIGGLVLGPVFASSTHGYDTVDPFRVDPRLGDDDDLARLLDACHARDMRVLLDGVFNHVSRDFPPFVDVLQHREQSQYRDWFRLDFGADGPDGFAYRDFEGHHSLVALNHRSDAVLDWASGVAEHWLARGVDGFRLDAAYAVLPEFWRRFIARVRDRYPDAFFFGEVIHGDYAAFADASGLDSVTQYELWKATWSAYNDRNCFELSWALQRHAQFCERIVPYTFVGNHDVTRLRTRLHDPAHIGHALALLFTVPGTPSVYYGDEFALAGTKEDRPGGDDAVRPPLPERDPVDDLARTTLAQHRTLIRFRRERPWLTTATLEITETANQHLQYVVRTGDRAVLVALNLGERAVPLAHEWNVVAGDAPGSSVAPNGWAVLERP